jgi:hypothetical protein
MIRDVCIVESLSVKVRDYVGGFIPYPTDDIKRGVAGALPWIIKQTNAELGPGVGRG